VRKQEIHTFQLENLMGRDHLGDTIVDGNDNIKMDHRVI